MNESHWQIIKPLAVESCTQLFGTGGTVVRCIGEVKSTQMTDQGMAGFVGFTSAQIRGGVGLAMPVALLQRTHPIGKARSNPAEGELRDWMCELANLLAGRLKTQLLSYGVAFRVSTPMVVMGKELRYPEDNQGTRRILEFQSLCQPFFVHVATQLTPGVHLREVPVLPEGTASEGDMLVF